MGQAEGIIMTKPTTPVLKNAKIEAKIKESGGGEICVSSTDLEIRYEGNFEGEVEEEGGITIQARKLLDIVRSFPDILICFELDKKNSQVKIEAEDRERVNVVFKVFGIEAKDYPGIGDGREDLDRFLMDGVMFKEMIERVIMCAAREDDRYYLNGIYLEKKGKDLNCVATDGKRLGFSQMKDNFEGEGVKDFGVIVPIKAFRELGKMLLTAGDCEVGVGKQMILFKLNEVEMTSILLEGHFPEYDKVVPKEYQSVMTVQREELMGGIDRVSRMIDPKELKIHMGLRPGKLYLKGKHIDFGEVEDMINCKTESEIDLAFNYKYILESVKQISEEEIFMGITQSDGPVLIRGEGEDHFYVVMPMRLERPFGEGLKKEGGSMGVEDGNEEDRNEEDENEEDGDGGDMDGGDGDEGDMDEGMGGK